MNQTYKLNYNALTPSKYYFISDAEQQIETIPFETIIQSSDVFNISLKNSNEGTVLQKIPAGKYDKIESKYYPYFDFYSKNNAGQYQSINVYDLFYPQTRSYSADVKVYYIYREQTDYGEVKILYYSDKEETWKQNETKKSLYFNYDFVNQQIERLNAGDIAGTTHVNAKLSSVNYIIKQLVNYNVPFPLLSSSPFYLQNLVYYTYNN